MSEDQLHATKLLDIIIDFQKEVRTEFKEVRSKFDEMENKLEPIHNKVVAMDTMLRTYNNLWGKIEEVEDRIDAIEVKDKTKDKIKFNAVTWISTLLAIGMFVIALVK